MWSAIVPSKLENIMPGWINVADRGIIGDGTTNVSTALQSLIDELNSKGGGVLYFPPGTYKIVNDIILADNVSLVGADRDAVTLKGSDYYTYLLANVNNCRIANLTFDWLRIAATSMGSAKGGNVVIENCKFLDHYYANIDLCVRDSGSQLNPGLVIRNCIFYRAYFYNTLTKIAITAEQVPVLIENCDFENSAQSGRTWTEISLSGYHFTLRNLRWRAWSGNATLVSTTAPVTIDRVWYNLLYDTKTIVNIGSSSIYVILTGENGAKSDCTFNLATGYPNNLIKLDEFAWQGRNPAGASLRLPTQRSTTSTSYVTLKKFRTTISGEIRVKAQFGNTGEEPGYQVYLMVLKNMNYVYTNDIDIPCSRGDLIEFQGRTTSAGNPMNLYQAWVYYIPIRAGDFYEVTD
jgi:hypothetical protein